jgi:hypothetical protein
VTDYAQKCIALDRGNVIRLRRAALRHQLQDGSVLPANVLRDPPWFTQDWRVFELLEACPGVGPHKIRYLNGRAHHEWVNLFAPIGELTERQKDWLIGQLPILVRRYGQRTAA